HAVFTGAVKVAVHQHHAAVVVLHVVGEIDLLGRGGVAGAGQLGEAAAFGIGRCGEDAIVVKNRRRTIGGAVGRCIIAPAFLAVGDAEADKIAVEAQCVKSVPVDCGGGARAGVAAAFVPHRADRRFPELFAGLFTQADHILGGAQVAHQENPAASDAGA